MGTQQGAVEGGGRGADKAAQGKAVGKAVRGKAAGNAVRGKVAEKAAGDVANRGGWGMAPWRAAGEVPTGRRATWPTRWAGKGAGEGGGRGADKEVQGKAVGNAADKVGGARRRGGRRAWC